MFSDYNIMDFDNNIKPINYNIYFHIDIKKLILYGKTTITVEILNLIDNIVINSKDLLIKKMLIADKQVKFQEDKKNESIIITGKFEKQILQMYIEYEHCIGIDMDGLYYVKQDDSIIFSTQLEPIYARKLFPCFDSPNLKCTFDITIESDKNKTFLSNMPISDTIDFGINKIVKFQTTPIMSTYLVCIVVGDVKKSEPIKVRDDLFVNGYYFDKSTNLLKSSIKTTALSIRYYEKLFGIEYKLPKLDIIAIPNFLSGAMENWGLVTFRESGLMTDKINNINWMINNIEVIFHEISHQWFGNLVTLNSWKDIWLNEATATYFSWLGLIDNYEHLFPSQWYYYTTYRSAMLMDGFESTHPISTEIKSSNDVIQYFDEISYSKGSCLINYISEFMNRDKFMLGISDYLKKYSWQSAIPEDLYSMLDERSVDKTYSISTLMKQFIHVKGYPLITVTKSNGKYIITKKKYSFVKSESESEFVMEFPLKIKYKINGEITENIINFKKEIILENEPIVNAGNMMLCMINYDNYYPNIDLMSIPELMHQFDCIYYLSISGYKNLNNFLMWTLEIFKKIDFKLNLNKTLCLFHLIIKNLLTLANIIESSLNQTSTFGIEFKKFIKEINSYITAIFIHVLNTDKNDISIMSWIVQSMEFLVTIDNKTIIEVTGKIFEHLYLKNEPTKFNSFPLHEILFKTIIKNCKSSNSGLNEELYNKIIKIKNETSDVFIRNSATWALAYSTDISKLNDIMENLFSMIKLQDISTFISHLSKNSLIQSRVIEWVLTDIKTNSHISYKNLSHIIEKLTPNIYNLELLNKLKKFYIKENDPSIYSIELDKIQWHINIVKNISIYTK
jgi:hypothetical protein